MHLAARAEATLTTLLMLVSVAAVGGCDGTSESHGSAPRTDQGVAGTGTLTGQVQYVGGPAPGSPRPVAGGTVTFAASGRTTAAMSEQGRFSVELAPGSYVVTATSPDYDSGGAVCEAVHPVRVNAGETASVEVLCQVR